MGNNFKELKDKITKAVFESVITGKKSKDFKQFVNEVKKSPILKEQLDIYNLVENEKFSTKEDAMFILERAMRVFEKYTTNEIEAANKVIVESFGGTFSGDELVYNTIISLFAKNSNFKYASTMVKSYNTIAESMIEEKPLIKETQTSLENKTPTKKEIKRATALLNERWSFLNDTERRIYKSFITNDIAEKESAYNSLLSENIKLVKRKLYESEDEKLDEKLELIETKLKEDVYSPDKKIEDYVKLLNLSTTLI